MQLLLYLEACKLHMNSFFRTKGFPIFEIFLEPFILIPDEYSVGARPKYEHNCLALSKLVNPSDDNISKAAVFYPIPTTKVMFFKNSESYSFTISISFTCNSSIVTLMLSI